MSRRPQPKFVLPSGDLDDDVSLALQVQRSGKAKAARTDGGHVFTFPEPAVVVVPLAQDPRYYNPCIAHECLSRLLATYREPIPQPSDVPRVDWLALTRILGPAGATTPGPQ